jgi:hypothetical protein
MKERTIDQCVNEALNKAFESSEDLRETLKDLCRTDLELSKAEIEAEQGIPSEKSLEDFLKSIGIKNYKAIFHKKNGKWETLEIDPKDKLLPAGTKISYENEKIWIKYPFDPREKLTVSSKYRHTVEAGDSLYSIFQNHFQELFPHGATVFNIDKVLKTGDGKTFLIIPDPETHLINPGQTVYIKDGKIVIEEVLKTVPKNTIQPELNLPETERTKAVNSTVKMAKGKVGGLLPEYLKKLRLSLNKLLESHKNKEIGIKEFDNICTKARVKVTREMWQNLTAEEFHTRRQNLIKSLGDKEADNAIASIMKLPKGLIPYGTQNLNYTEDYKSVIKKSSQDSGISVSWIEEVIYTESKGSPLAYSYARAWGMMQMLDGVYKGNDKYDTNLSFKESINPLNPLEAIPRAAHYLAGIKTYLQPQIDVFGLIAHDVVLQAYNCGPVSMKSAIKKGGRAYFAYLPKETQRYLGGASRLASN